MHIDRAAGANLFFASPKLERSRYSWCMNNNLYAEKRLDKNGHLVTRHVKPEDTSSQNSNQLPPPSIGTPNKPINSILEKLVDSVVGFLIGADNGTDEYSAAQKVLTERLSELPAKTLEHLKTGWGKVIAYTDAELGVSDFTRFAHSTRDKIKDFLTSDQNDPLNSDYDQEESAHTVEHHMDELVSRIPPYPEYEPTIHLAYQAFEASHGSDENPLVADDIFDPLAPDDIDPLAGIRAQSNE